MIYIHNIFVEVFLNILLKLHLILKKIIEYFLQETFGLRLII